jgi:hypothetical protein
MKFAFGEYRSRVQGAFGIINKWWCILDTIRTSHTQTILDLQQRLQGTANLFGVAA